MRDAFHFPEISEMKTLTFLEQEELAELSCDGSVKIAFKFIAASE